MTNYRIARASQIRARFGEQLDNDSLRAVTPSIFAETAHESRSSRFVPIPTIRVIEGLRNEGFAVVSAAQSKPRDESKREFTKHMIRLRRADQLTQTPVVGDSVFEIVLLNANDGTAAYSMIPGMFRFICTNGMMVGETFDELKVRHSGNAVGDVIEGAYTVLGEAPKVIESMRDWQGLTLSQDEREIFAQSAHVLRFGDDPESAPIAPTRLLEARRRDDSAPDLWRTFNRVQENLIRGGQTGFTVNENGQRRRATVRAITGVQQDRSLNRALWTLTERMAQLRAA